MNYKIWVYERVDGPDCFWFIGTTHYMDCDINSAFRERDSADTMFNGQAKYKVVEENYTND